MVLNAFTIINDDAPWFAHVPDSDPESVEFKVGEHLNVSGPSLLNYTVTNRVTYSYSVRVNGQVVVRRADAGPDGEHRVRWRLPPGILQAGSNDLDVEAHTDGDVYFTDIEAWLRQPGSEAAEPVAISEGPVTLRIAPATATRRFPFRMPDALDVNAEAAVDVTIRQEQPRLTYTVHVNGGVPVEGSSPLPPHRGSYDLLEIVQTLPVVSGGNRLLLQLGYGGNHLYVSETVAWWQHRVTSVCAHVRSASPGARVPALVV